MRHLEKIALAGLTGLALAATGPAALAAGESSKAAPAVKAKPNTTITAAVTSGNYFPTSGSTALDNAIKDYFLRSSGICQATPNVYIDGATSLTGSDVHHTTVTCTSNASFGTVVAGTTVIGLSKESSGGSLEGTIYVARGQALPQIDPTLSITCTGAGVSVAAGTKYASQQAYTLFTGCSTNNNASVPVAGWADEAPTAWQGFGARPITTADISALNSDQLVQNAFGIAVSLNLYRALQRMQGLTLGDDLATMPSLSSSAITAALTNQFPGWGSLTNAAGTAVNSSSFAGAKTVDSTVWICRRGTSSGTSAWLDINFDGQRCNAGASTGQPNFSNKSGICNGIPTQTPPLTPTDWGCSWDVTTNTTPPLSNEYPNLVDQVFPGAGTGDVESCLGAHDQNDDFAIGYLTTNAKFGAALSLGTSADTTDAIATRWRFIAIDGRQPTLVNEANGVYPYVEDDVLNTLKTASGNTAAFRTYVTSASTGFASSNIVNDFAAHQTSSFASGTTTADANYYGGVLFDALQASAGINPTPTTTAEVTTSSGSPTSSYTQLLGTPLNNCTVPTPETNVINSN
jgi:hypothetical protein